MIKAISDTKDLWEIWTSYFWLHISSFWFWWLCLIFICLCFILVRLIFYSLFVKLQKNNKSCICRIVQYNRMYVVFINWSRDLWVSTQWSYIYFKINHLLWYINDNHIHAMRELNHKYKEWTNSSILKL